MLSNVIGGAMLPHAPQFFTMPETEDPTTVAKVKEVAHEIGGRLKALKPDLWIIFANDRAMIGLTATSFFARPIFRSLAFIVSQNENVIATLAYLGLAILGWGGFAAFFSHPPLIARSHFSWCLAWLFFT